MAKLVSKTYGEALFELAHEENRASEMLKEIQSVQEILKSNPEFCNMMLHPGIAKQEKLKIVDEVFKGRTSDEITGFIRIRYRCHNIFCPICCFFITNRYSI